MLVEQLIRDLKTMPQNAVVQARIYGRSFGPSSTVQWSVELFIPGSVSRPVVVQLILDRDDRKKGKPWIDVRVEYEKWRKEHPEPSLWESYLAGFDVVAGFPPGKAEAQRAAGLRTQPKPGEPGYGG